MWIVRRYELSCARVRGTDEVRRRSYLLCCHHLTCTISKGGAIIKAGEDIFLHLHLRLLWLQPYLLHGQTRLYTQVYSCLPPIFMIHQACPASYSLNPRGLTHRGRSKSRPSPYWTADTCFAVWKDTRRCLLHPQRSKWETTAVAKAQQKTKTLLALSVTLIKS